MQPAVQATTRTPGPSTADPVVNECRNPMSPVASAVRTSVSGTSSPRSTRSSNGLFACDGTCDRDSRLSIAARGSSVVRRPVEGAVDDVHLLLARQPHEVHGVARDADRQAAGTSPGDPSRRAASRGSAR